MAHTLSLDPFDPFATVPPWWALDLIEELRAARLERQHRAFVAAGRKPFDWSQYDNPESNARVQASMARLMAGTKLNPAPPGFD